MSEKYLGATAQQWAARAAALSMGYYTNLSEALFALAKTKGDDAPRWLDETEQKCMLSAKNTSAEGISYDAEVDAHDFHMKMLAETFSRVRSSL